jgi:hypothetical protein
MLRHARMMADSFHRWTGGELLDPPAASLSDHELAQRLFEAPRVLVSHGTEADPVLNYGNRAALARWELDWDTFTRTPSRLTAEAPAREERARLLAEVTRNGFIANYAGIRISSTGKRFRISQAIVWNLVDSEGKPAGQAATFDRWEDAR